MTPGARLASSAATRAEHHLPQLLAWGGVAGLALAGVSPAMPVLLAVALVVVAIGGFAPRAAVLVALTVALAGQLATARLAAIDSPGAALEDGQRVSGRAHLRELPRPGPFGPSVELAMTSGDARGSRLLARLPYGTGSLSNVAPGAELELSGTFQRVRAPGASFDFAAHLRRRGVVGELKVDRLRLTGDRRGGLRGGLDEIGARAHAAIGAGLPATGAALARGMAIGADEGVPKSVRDDFRDAGLSHVLAASGQNVMLLVALAIPLFTAAGLSHRARIAASIVLIALYVPLAGAGPSIQRAGTMGAASLLAVGLARPASRWYALALAACATLAHNPRICGDPGWQLSFAAVTGILLLAPGIRSALSALPRAVGEGIAVTVAATLATAPLLAYHFAAVSLVGALANVVALPLVAPIMWLGMLRAVVGQAPPVGGLLARAAEVANAALGLALAPLVAAFERLAALFADVPGGQLRLTLEQPLAVAVVYGVVAAGAALGARAIRRLDTHASTAVARVRRLPRTRRIALLAATAVAIGLVLARGLTPPAPPATLTITFLDVGQGDATLIQHPDGSAVLFDGGPPEAGVARLLRRAGVRRLSALVMTHPSRDHHGGLLEVVERTPVDVLLDGGDGTRDPAFRAVVARARAGGARTVPALAPLSLRAGSIHIDVLSPSPRPAGPPSEDPNPRAAVALVSSGGFDLLLSGDAESEALLPLALPDVDAMKVAHHGSADPGLAEVLERVQPEIASIPVGPNTYGHPAPSTLAALREAGVATWRTDRHGSIRLTIERGAVRIEPERGGHVDTGP
jgi:competence protein ComEC